MKINVKRKNFLAATLAIMLLAGFPAAAYAGSTGSTAADLPESAGTDNVYAAAYTGSSAGKSSAVKVAFLDTGISTLYIDAEQVETGQNYVFEENDTKDRVGHGTATASLVLGSVTLGIDGSCESATAVPLVVYDTYPSGVAKYGGSAMMAEAIYDAVDTYGCRVINMSIGVAADNEDLREAVAYAEKKGAVIVASVGNDNLDAPEIAYYPASYSTVIGVGSAKDGAAADFSQRGKSVFLLADGYKLKTATNLAGKKTKLLTGTSYSAALVSGVAASMLSACPALTPADVREILSKSCTDVMAAGRDDDSGYGILDSERAIEAAALVSQGLSISAAVEKAAAGSGTPDGSGSVISSDGNSASGPAAYNTSGENMLAELLVRLVKVVGGAVNN